MDQFYLKNAALYQSYIDKLDPCHPPPHFIQQPVSLKQSTEALHNNPNMTICVRIRPMLEDDDTAGFPCAVYPRLRSPDSQHQTVDLHDLYNHPRRRLPILKSSTHQVEKLFDASSTTERVYQDVVHDLVLSVLDGQLGTLFAYGQTGSGKTFTVTELQKLAVSDLVDRHATISMTIIELAGNSAFDLLNMHSRVAVLEDASGNTHLSGAVEHRTTNKDEALALLETAASYRKCAPTLKNDASSRSHSICRISVSTAKSNEPGFLYMVDLAGSEAARDVAEHGPERMRETRDTNVSLSVLKDCIRRRAEAAAVTNRRKIHVPIRGSTLTKVLKHVFDPDAGQTCKTTVIACLNPSLADVASSKNTLRYAELLGQSG